MDQDFRKTQNPERLVIADGGSADADRSGPAIEKLVRFKDVILHRRGGGHDFECRTRFEEIPDGPVDARAALGREPVGVVGGGVGHGQDVAGIGIRKNNRPPFRTVFEDGFFEFGFRVVLDGGIEGQRDIAARKGLTDGLDMVTPALGVPEDQAFSRLATKDVVVLIFDAGLAVAVDIHASQNVGRQMALGIEALPLLLEIDTLQREGRNPGRRVVIDLSLDPGEGMTVRDSLEEGGFFPLGKVQDVSQDVKEFLDNPTEDSENKCDEECLLKRIENVNSEVEKLDSRVTNNINQITDNKNLILQTSLDLNQFKTKITEAEQQLAEAMKKK